MITLQKILAYGLYLLAFLLPWQTRWIIKAGEINGSYSEYGTISLYATDFLLLAIFIIFVFFKIKSKDFLIKKIATVWMILAGLDLAIFVSIFLAPDIFLAIYKYLLFLAGLALFVMLKEASYDRIRIIWFFLTGLAIQAVLGIWQFATQTSFACKWLGLASHEAFLPGVSVVEDLSGGRWLRAYGGFDHPNIFGALMAIGIIFAVVLFINSIAQKKCWTRIVIFIYSALYVVGLFFSFSRAAWLAFGLALAVYLVSIIIWRDFRKIKSAGAFIGFLTAIFIVLFIINFDIASSRFSADNRLAEKSNTERIASLEQSTAVIKNNWLLGVGVGNYSLSLSSIIPGEEAWFYQPVHNVFLLIWSEVGIFGLVFFLFLLIYFLVHAVKAKKSIELALLIFLISILAFDHWCWSLHFGALFFWFFVGLLYGRYELK